MPPTLPAEKRASDTFDALGMTINDLRYVQPHAHIKGLCWLASGAERWAKSKIPTILKSSPTCLIIQFLSKTAKKCEDF